MSAVIGAGTPGGDTGVERAINRKSPLHPPRPERICWGCEQFCPADRLACGNGTIRAPHPAELFGDDWVEWLDEKEGSRRRDRSS